jgi:succinylarginine dihydrolase
MSLIAPEECAESPGIRRALSHLVGSGTPVKNVHFVNVRQSMRNGGGPACLRLRVVLTEAELAAVRPQVMLTEALYAQLVDWVTRHYREQLSADDLADPALLQEGRTALDRLTEILDLGSVYRFQRR